jgi:hypothetical protein
MHRSILFLAILYFVLGVLSTTAFSQSLPRTPREVVDRLLNPLDEATKNLLAPHPRMEK